MKKKIIIIIGIVVVAVLVTGYFVFRNSDNASDNVHVTMRQDPVTGLSIYNNLDYGFSVAYLSAAWRGPVETLDPNADIADPNINVSFVSASTTEIVVIVGKPGDTESLNDF